MKFRGKKTEKHSLVLVTYHGCGAFFSSTMLKCCSSSSSATLRCRRWSWSPSMRRRSRPLCCLQCHDCGLGRHRWRVPTSLLLVDAVEGIHIQTHTILHQRERVTKRKWDREGNHEREREKWRVSVVLEKIRERDKKKHNNSKMVFWITVLELTISRRLFKNHLHY